jgi:formylglycine-generating enzyme required for sulfatase activity
MVFVSHASEDKPAADAMCAALERSGVRCWIAPRDIMPGDDWADSILKAITSSKLMVLIFSRHTAQSPHVKREIERAVHHGIPIAPLRVEDVLPDGALEFFLSSQHWSDLFPGPIQEHVRDVLGRIRGLLGVGPQSASAPASDPRGVDSAQPAPQRPAPATPSIAALNAKSGASWKWAAAFLVLLVLGMGGYIVHQFSLKKPAVQQSADSAEAQVPPPAVPPEAKPALPKALASEPVALSSARTNPPEPKPADILRKAFKDQKEFTNSLGMKLVRIEAGDFMMGSPRTEQGRSDDETQHHVRLTKPFFMATTPVTQGQWSALIGTTVAQQCNKANPPLQLVGEGDAFPMYYVSWDEAVDFCGKLSAREGKHYRLPTEAEWEYAARAGSVQTYCFGDNVKQLGDYAWYGDNSGSAVIDSANIWATDLKNAAQRVANNGCQTHPVGTKKSNDWGLFDMQGNVFQWCSDWNDKYPNGDATDPTGPANGTWREMRGGSWSAPPRLCRCAFRQNCDVPGNRKRVIGFRVALDVQ